MRPLQSFFRRGAFAVALGCLGLFLNASLIAGDLRVIELVDGSQIAGEIVLFEHGVYTIQSESLGRLHIPDSDIRVIRSRRPPSAPQPAPSPQYPDHAGAPALSGYEAQISGDPEVLSMVMALQNDPDVLAVLNDPSIMQAIAARDYNALQNNAKLLELGNNPTIRQILDLVGTQ